MSLFEGTGLDFVEREFCDGYLDGRQLDTPRPGRNRSPAYRHSWIVGRREKLGKHLSYHEAMRRAAIAEAKMSEGVGG